jgi:hypothetical protein
VDYVGIGHAACGGKVNLFRAASSCQIASNSGSLVRQLLRARSSTLLCLTSFPRHSACIHTKDSKACSYCIQLLAQRVGVNQSAKHYYYRMQYLKYFTRDVVQSWIFELLEKHSHESVDSARELEAAIKWQGWV